MLGESDLHVEKEREFIYVAQGPDLSHLIYYGPFEILNECDLNMSS